MRIIKTCSLTDLISEMCIEVNCCLSEDMKQVMDKISEKEESAIGKRILQQLEENLVIAETEQIPICQDTGMAVVFLEIGQEIHFEGGILEAAIQEGIRTGYQNGYLRKSVVGDPIIRENTGDNTPGIIYYDIVPGDKLKVTVAPKGFGSENMSKIFMLKPSDGLEGIKKAVLETVSAAGPNACPPVVVGVGIGGTFEKCANLAKKALIRDLRVHSDLEHIEKLEKELLDEINKLQIGPGGFGGKITALGVNIEVYPTHIAGLPVAVNMCCHVNRHITKII